MNNKYTGMNAYRVGKDSFVYPAGKRYNAKGVKVRLVQAYAETEALRAKKVAKLAAMAEDNDEFVA